MSIFLKPNDEFNSPVVSVSQQKASQRKKSILIAGGAGFLGSRLCEIYLEEKCRVTCLDNLSTGRIKNVEELFGNPDFSFLDFDISKPLTFRSGYDFIYNMACPASPPKYQADPIQTLKTNLHGAFNMLDLAQQNHARILQSSTSEVYGDPSVSPQPETYWGNVNTIGPRSCYDEGKRAAETVFWEYQKCYGVDVRIARIFNAYGPGMDPTDGRVVSNFIMQALQGQPITIYGDGSQTRSFCYREDMVAGLMALMHCDSAGHDPVNIGNPTEFTMIELAELVLEKVNSKSKISFCDLPLDDPKQRCPDITCAKTMLGWRPTVELADGLNDTIAYFLSEIAGERTRKMAAGS
jgi:UDP-glucuronate decarboxylase